MKDYSFMAFAVCMGTLILGIVCFVVYAVGYLNHWWK